MNPLSYKYLADKIPFVQNGKTLLSIGFHITFYFGDGSVTESRQAVIKLFNEYMHLCGDQLKWQTHPVPAGPECRSLRPRRTVWTKPQQRQRR